MFCLLPATIVCFFALIVWPLCLTWCTETFTQIFWAELLCILSIIKKKNIYIDCNCNTYFTDFVYKFHIIWQKIFAFTSLWEIYISCTWFAKSTLQKFAQVQYSLNMGLFETAISQYWQRLTLWFLHLQWLQSPNGAESEIFRKKLSAFHFKVVFKRKTFQSFFVRECLWNMTESFILLHFIITSNTQHKKDPAVNIYQDLLWPCSVECFHAKMFRCKAINFWSEFSPSAGWAGLLEKVKLWGKAHRQVVSFKKIQFFLQFPWRHCR